MTVRRLTFFLAILALAISSVSAQHDLAPLTAYDKGPEALEFEHFPSRLHTFLWRNWPVVKAERLAEVLETPVENVHRVAATMGLPPQGTIEPQWESSQGYITVLRRNWHLLPYPQLLKLLNQTPEQLAESLQEDDFLFIKLGSIKPQCEPLTFTEPTEEQNRHAEKIAGWIREELGDDWTKLEEPRFEFLKEFFPPPFIAGSIIEPTENKTDSPFEIRFLFSYFATFGDPLMDPEVKSYPDALLRRLAEHGVNGVWLHTTLKTLSPPTETFPDYGKDHEIRLQSLKTLVDRAAVYGIKVYLYMNEPRTMPTEFFQGDRQKLAGVPYGSHTALCTSTPEVKRWLSDSLKHVFRETPGLGGIFTITASENRTNCTSHYQKDKCPRCKDRSVGDIIGELNTVMAEAVHSVDPKANVLCWDWGWSDDVAPEIIEKLPESVWLMSVSEWSLPIERGGVKSNVGEYSISSPGPGPRAKRHWELARARGLKTVAKVQFNVTWELAAIPYIPVPNLVAEHASNLAGSGVNGLMLSWSLGGWPSPNLEIAHAFQSPDLSKQQTPEELENRQNAVLKRLAYKYYDMEYGRALRAWKEFSDGFREYPYHIGLCYNGPQHWGPAVLVHPKPTGFRATMVGIPYDDVKTWCAIYPPETAAGQFRKVAFYFRAGCRHLDLAKAGPQEWCKPITEAEYRFAEAAMLHFDSAANMIEFNTLRNRRLESTDEAEKVKLFDDMKKVLDAERKTAFRMYRLVKTDSRIGYESSNHYWYIPIDIAEKIVSIRHFLDTE